MKNIDHLIVLSKIFIKLDIRGNSVVSRRKLFSNKEDKTKIIEKFKVGDVIKDAVVKDTHHLPLHLKVL